MWRRGENQAQSFVFAVVCSGNLGGPRGARSGASCERRGVRAMGSEHGLLRHNESEVADRNAGIVLKINMERLKSLASARN
jgi:hypothetical protein